MGQSDPLITIEIRRSQAVMVRALIRVCMRGQVNLAAATLTLNEYRKVLEVFVEAINKADQLSLEEKP